MQTAAHLDLPLNPEILISPTPEVATVANPPPAAALSNLKQSRVYQSRDLFCSLSVFSTWAIALLSTPWIHMGSPAERILTAIGWTCFAAGLFVRFWAILYIGGKKSTSVICEGPYSITRNPLYWGTLLVLLSQGFFYHNLVFALGLIPPMLIYYFGVIPAEERHLTNRLGEEYLAYCQAVPRIGPRFSRYRSPAEIVVNLKSLRSEVKHVLGWIWLPIMAHLLNTLREFPSWPDIFNLP